jgi:hypothetical protein
MTEERLLDMWQTITGYIEDWETKFSEIIEELEGLVVMYKDEEESEEDYTEFGDIEDTPESLLEDVKQMRYTLRETVQQALRGEIASIDVEETFRTVGEFLRDVEEKIIKFREMEDYEDLEEENDYYDEEDNY